MKTIKKHQSDYNNDLRKKTKRMLIYLAIIFVVFVVSSTFFTILKVETWAIMLFNVVLGGGIILISEALYKKHEEKKKAKDFLSDKPDPFA